MALKPMDNVGIVVDDLGGTIDFFRERLRKRGAQLVGEVVQYKTRIDSAISAGLKGFSSDSPKNSAKRICDAGRHRGSPVGHVTRVSRAVAPHVLAAVPGATQNLEEYEGR